MGIVDKIHKADDSFLVLRGYYRGKRAKRDALEGEAVAKHKAIRDAVEQIGYDAGYDGRTLAEAREDLREYWDMKNEEVEENEEGDLADEAADDAEGADLVEETADDDDDELADDPFLEDDEDEI
ncbi:MAG: hypothetical protein AAGB26_07465 [Planctomycetota bacterium]